MEHSKSQIDRSGRVLAKETFKTEDDLAEVETIFDEYRSSHLRPLTDLTLDLQRWLTDYGKTYYIAQRLKRKPQILRKLNRLSARLTQLQDIGGCRIIVDDNASVDRIWRFVEDKVRAESGLLITRSTDYRDKGRDDTGYRALHLLITNDGYALELQIRSQIQHYWAESIERTSVIYGHHLKEKEGDQQVIDYFKYLSDIFYEFECGREPSPHQKLEIDRLRENTEKIIKDSDKNRIFDSYVNEDIIKTLAQIESQRRGFNNWIMVFDWNSGSFTSWDIVDRDPALATARYVEYENQYPAKSGFEVVMIGSSDVATVRKTHSHYFGIASYDDVLEKLDQSIVRLGRRANIDSGARQILLALYSRNYWGKSKACSIPTLKNHYCRNVITFDASLETLIEQELVSMPSANGPLSLNLKNKQRIKSYL